MNNSDKLLSDILEEEQGMVTIDSQFKPINIGHISDDYKYLGGKAKCADYIKNMLGRPSKDIYVHRTIRKTYKISDIPDAEFMSGYQKVEY